MSMTKEEFKEWAKDYSAADPVFNREQVASHLEVENETFAELARFDKRAAELNQKLTLSGGSARFLARAELVEYLRGKLNDGK